MRRTIFLFLLLATTSFADVIIEDDTVSSTMMSTSSSDSTSTMSGISPSDSTAVSDTSVTTASAVSQSAETSGPSSPQDTSGMTTLYSGTGSTISASSSAPQGTSSVVTQPATVSPTTETLPPVTVSYVEFSAAQCSNGFCSYSYVAPYNDPAVLATDSSIIATDNTYYKSYSQNVSDYNANVSATISDAQSKITALRAQLEEAQSLLNKMQAQLSQTINNTNEAVANLNYANYYIKTKIDSTSPYYYCTIPPTPPPTTPTPTAPPTTTPDPCSVYNCTLGNDTCAQMFDETSGRMQPFCLGCEGNMDGFQQCEYSTCGDYLTANSGRFWSPGYDGTSGNLSDFSGRTCTWNYAQAYLFNTTAYNLTFLGQTDDQPSMTLIPIKGDDGSGNYPINSLTNLKKVNGFLNNNNITSFQLQLIIPDGYDVENSFFFWEFLDQIPTPPPPTL